MVVGHVPMHAIPIGHMGIYLCEWMGACLNKDIIAQFKFTRSGGQRPNFNTNLIYKCVITGTLFV